MVTSRQHLHDHIHICPYCELCDECHGSGWIGCCENTGRSCSSCNKTGRVDVVYSKDFINKLSRRLSLLIADAHDHDVVMSATLMIGFSSYYSVLAKTREEERRFMRESIKSSVNSVMTRLTSLEVIKVHGYRIDVKGKLSDLIEAICLSGVIAASC